MTFYRSVNDLPDFLDYTMKNRTYRYFQGEPLFPFGYGLSYTTFDISKPAYIKNKVQLTVKNTGTMDGTEVVQVYIRRLADKEGPLKTLRAYQRVTLKTGGAQMVAIDFPRERFECWDAKTNTMRVLPGEYEIMVGASSADKDLKKVKIKLK
jgi:beta-glucosidase